MAQAGEGLERQRVEAERLDFLLVLRRVVLNEEPAFRGRHDVDVIDGAADRELQSLLVGHSGVRSRLALAGAGRGLLWWHLHPAKGFMGDTGSLAIGGALGTAAICTKQELMLLIIGGVFVMEAMSVILQVGSFKLRKKRIFRMSHIHHHFELLGWHENQVINRFWILSIMFAIFGLALLKIV